MIFRVEQLIEAPIDAVWRHLSEPSLMGTWMSGITDMRTVDGRPLSNGSRLLFTARGAERSSEVVAFEPGRRMTLRSTQGSFTATYQYDLHSEGGATTRASLRAECVARGLIVIVAPLIGLLIRKVDGGQLVQLDQAVTGHARHRAAR